MRTAATGLFILAVCASTEARAQVLELTQFNQPVVAVTGEGEASIPADYGRLGFSYRGEGKSQVEALRALTLLRTRVESGLNNLRGVTAIKIEPGDLRVQEVWTRSCDVAEDRYPPSPQVPRSGCVVEGYVAASSVSAEISPAEVSGDAASLAAQLGAINVNLEGGGVRNPAALEQSAAKAALADAQAKAESIAAASGIRLGPVVRIQDQQLAADRVYKEYADQVVGVALLHSTAPVSPTVRLDLPPPPVKRQAVMSVIYSIQH